MARKTWGKWTLKPDTLELIHKDGYAVDLGSCTSSAEALDWIMQVAAKTWAQDDDVAGLVRAFRDILDPQATLCSGGKDRTLSVESIKKRVHDVA